MTIKERVMIAGETKIAVVLLQNPNAGYILSIDEAHELVTALLDNIEIAQANRKKQHAESLTAPLQK